MVNNIFKILDENTLKQLSIVEYNMVKLDLYNLVYNKTKMMKSERIFDDELCDFVCTSTRNVNYKEPTPRIKYALKEYAEWLHHWDFQNFPSGPKNLNTKFISWCGGEDIIYDYLEIIPFTPSVMINISPDWKSGENRTNKQKIKLLKLIIEQYLSESERYDYYSYVIENGSRGDHIHAHIVAHMNPRLIKSINSHLSKGNHTQQLKKYASKLKGMEGIIKGPGVQKTFLRTQQIVDDKLDYLIEAKKPEGHKNLSIIDGGFVNKTLFTVK